MQQRNMWDGVWAAQLSTRLNEDVEQAMQDALQSEQKNERGE